MVDKRSPTTSDRISAALRAGEARRASPPALTSDRARRTALNSSIGAPERSSKSYSLRRAASVMPGRGCSNMADPPPEISTTTRSPGMASRSRAAAAAPAARLPSSGRGCAAGMA